MANGFFDAFKQEQYGDAAGPGHGVVEFEADTIRITLLDNADDDPNRTTDQDYADIAAGARVANGALASKTGVMSGGVYTFDAADLVFSSVTGDQSESLLMDKNSGTESTSLLICEWDTATGLPLTPNEIGRAHV